MTHPHSTIEQAVDALVERLAKAAQDDRTVFGDPEPSTMTVNGVEVACERVPTLHAPGPAARAEHADARLAVVAFAIALWDDDRCDEAHDLLVRAAGADHAAYPQYEGYWDGWSLTALPRRVRFKSGDAEAGDVVLCRYDDRDPEFAHWTIYNARTGTNCALPTGVLPTPEEA